jgi:predicted GNAT family acetyltransferase
MSPAEGQIRHEGRERDGSFFIEHGGRRIAELTYRMTGADAMLDHTWVDPSLRGGGEAKRLVDAAAEWARREHLKLVPACSYVRALFTRSSAYADVQKR